MRLQLDFAHAGNGSGVQKISRELVSHAKATGHNLEHVIAQVSIAWVGEVTVVDDSKEPAT